MFRVQVRWPNGSVSEFAVEKECITLGRAPENDIYLPSPQASRMHAKAYRNGDQVIIEDLQSANGTFLRQQRLALPTPINPDDPIKLGDVFIRVTYDGMGASAANDSGTYSMAQKLGDRKNTNAIGASAGAELRRMMGQNPGVTQTMPAMPKRTK